MNDDQRAMYSAAVSCRNTEVSLRLARTHSFLFINVGGFTFIGTQPEPSLQLAISFIGFFLGILWLATNQLTTQRINYWEGQLASLEELSPVEQKIGVFSGQSYEKTFTAWFRFGNLIGLLATLALAAWAILFAIVFRELQQP